MFSIIVPVYQVEKYLEECIKSVLDQNIEEYELILIDDGSMDNSGNICEAYSSQYMQIKTFHKENGGQLHSRLYGLSKACGDFIIFLDSDDRLLPGALIKIKETFYNNPNCDCVLYGYQKSLNDKVIEIHTADRDVILYSTKEIFDYCLYDTNNNALWRKAVRATVIQKKDYAGYYHLRHGEDLLQSIDIYSNSRNMIIIHDILYDYRVNPQSVTQTQRDKEYYIDFSVREYVLKRYMAIEENTDADIKKYRNQCTMQFLKNVYNVANLKITWKEIIRLLKRMKSSDYWMKFISLEDPAALSLKNKIIYFLFKNNLHPLLLIITKGYHLVKNDIIK